MDSALFLNPNKLWLTLQNSTFFAPSFPPPPICAAQFQHMVWCFTLEASDFQSQLSFLRLFFCFWFWIFQIFLCNFFSWTWQDQDSGNKKVEEQNFSKGRFSFFLFFFFFTSYHLIESFFNYFFLCSIAKILAELQEFGTLEAPLWLHFPILAKMHFFYVLSKSNEAIFNVSTLGQSSDLFLLLFFAPYHCWNIDVMQCLSQFAALFSLPYRSLFRHGFWARFCKGE